MAKSKIPPPTLRAAVRHTNQGVILELYGQPVPAKRPRVTRWSTYYDGPYGRWKPVAEAALSSVVGKTPTLLTGPLNSHLMIFREKAKTSKLLYPNGDNDNYEKAVFDLVNKRLIQDDDQIIENFTKKLFVPHGTEGFLRLTLTHMDEDELQNNPYSRLLDSTLC